MIYGVKQYKLDSGRILVANSDQSTTEYLAIHCVPYKICRHVGRFPNASNNIRYKVTASANFNVGAMMFKIIEKDDRGKILQTHFYQSREQFLCWLRIHSEDGYYFVDFYPFDQEYKKIKVPIKKKNLAGYIYVKYPSFVGWRKYRGKI
ncbi:MAG: hypothetical protein WC523_04245 [Patescibacteria group bacterium]